MNMKKQLLYSIFTGLFLGVFCSFKNGIISGLYAGFISFVVVFIVECLMTIIFNKTKLNFAMKNIIFSGISFGLVMGIFNYIYKNILSGVISGVICALLWMLSQTIETRPKRYKNARENLMEMKEIPVVYENFAIYHNKDIEYSKKGFLFLTENTLYFKPVTTYPIITYSAKDYPGITIPLNFISEVFIKRKFITSYVFIITKDNIAKKFSINEKKVFLKQISKLLNKNNSLY